MDASVFFGVLGGLTPLLSYSLYLHQTIKGKSTPNPASWGIWMVISLLNVATYYSLALGSLYQGLVVFSAALMSSVVFIYAFFKGKLSRITAVEIVSIILAFAVGVFWQATSNARMANLLLQGIYAISYVPSIIGIYRGTAKEYPFAWGVAFLAYFFSTVSLLLNPPGDWITFVHPIVNGLLGNGSIALMAMLHTKKK